MSLIDAAANVVVSNGVAAVAQKPIFPVLWLQATLAQNLQMGAIFSVVSIALSFAMQRAFEAIRVHAD